VSPDPPAPTFRSSPRIGVVLLQMGAPDCLEAVEPFLYNLFRDLELLDFPFSHLKREPLARIVASRRSAKLRKQYLEIGGSSPLAELTARQAKALEIELNKALLSRVVVAMRYWRPLMDAAVIELLAFAPDEIVLLPLYPQYSSTTTGTSLKEWQRQFPAQPATRVHLVADFHAEPLYVEAVVERIEQGLERFRRSNGHAGRTPSHVHLLFAARSVPRGAIHRGDPYQAQTEATVKDVLERGRWPNPHSLAYLCPLVPEHRLLPSIREALQDVAAFGAEGVLAIPISFVSDQLETLHEINIEARAMAEKLGIGRFETTEGLNDSPGFIAALADLVRRTIGARPKQ